MDFNNSTIFSRLRLSAFSQFEKLISPILIADESVFATYSGMRDGVVFTNKRLIAVNVQGMTGVKTEITTFPYAKIQTFSIETAGMFDVDAELKIWFSGLGKVTFQFAKSSDMYNICRYISELILDAAGKSNESKIPEPSRPLSAPVSEDERKSGDVPACVIERTYEDVKKESETKGWICKKCGTLNPITRRSCLECGSPK